MPEPYKKTEEKATPDAGWVGQLRYSKSFTAKLLLADAEVKGYYAEVATELLSYEKVRSHTGWSGVSFIAGRTQIARCVISGKTLCLYLAADPDSISGSKYKARDVAGTRKYEKTPAMLRIKSQGGVKNAVQCIGDVAAAAGLAKKDPPPEPILPRLFPADSFHNLVTRGLIRFVRAKSEAMGALGTPGAPGDAQDAVPDSADTTDATDAQTLPSSEDTGIYTDTAASARDVISRHAGYVDICAALAGGDASVKLSEKKMLRALDEGWVRTIEDALPALDELMRRPSHFIAETEEILPMELTRKITGRSVVHLCQHTDYISSVDGDEVTPSKLLNVFREDSVLTYENKFLNTLLAHLYFFVTKRYRVALESGVDERVDCVRFENSFFHDEARGKISVSIELSEPIADAGGVKKSFLGTPLWARVERLNEIVKSYMESDFVRQMGRNYVNPPILRTNAILKNKYFRQCLDLWNFLEGYDESGFGITVCENVRDPDDAYIHEMYDSVAMQYLLFRHHARGEYDDSTVLASYTSEELRPHINVRVRDAADSVEAGDFDTELEVAARRSTQGAQGSPNAQGTSGALDAQPSSDGSDESGFVYDPEERDVLFAVRVALKAAEFYDAQNAAAPEDYSDELYIRGVRYEKSFEAKLRLAGDELKGYFVGLANALLAYDRVKMRTSRAGCTFVCGRTPLARMTLKGKSLYFYAALDPAALPPAYYVRDVSGVKRYSTTPSLLRVRSDRWMKYALQLVAGLAAEYSLEPADAQEGMSEEPLSVDDFPMMSFDELLEHDWIRRVEVRGRSETADADGTEAEAGVSGASESTEVSEATEVTEVSDEPDISDEIVDADDNVDIDTDDTDVMDEAEEADEPDDVGVEYDSSAIVRRTRESDGTPAAASSDSARDTNNTEDIDSADDFDSEPDSDADDGLAAAISERLAAPERGGQSQSEPKSGGGQYFENSAANPENYDLPDKLPDTDRRSKNERLLSDIRYPGTMDYSRPTQLGVDDSSDFIKDIEENSVPEAQPGAQPDDGRTSGMAEAPEASEALERRRRRGLVGRIFGRLGRSDRSGRTKNKNKSKK